MQFIWSILGVLLLMRFGAALKCQVGYKNNTVTPKNNGTSTLKECKPVGNNCFSIDAETGLGAVTYFGCVPKKRCSRFRCGALKNTIRAITGKAPPTSIRKCKIGCCDTNDCNSGSVDSMSKNPTQGKTTSNAKAAGVTQPPAAPSATLKPNATQTDTATSHPQKTISPAPSNETTLENNSTTKIQPQKSDQPESSSKTITKPPLQDSDSTKPVMIPTDKTSPKIPEEKTVGREPVIEKEILPTEPVPDSTEKVIDHEEPDVETEDETDTEATPDSTDADDDKQFQKDDEEATTFVDESSTKSASGSMYSISFSILIGIYLLNIVFVNGGF